MKMIYETNKNGITTELYLDEEEGIFHIHVTKNGQTSRIEKLRRSVKKD